MKRIKENDELITEKCNDIAQEVFNTALEHGGADIPMPYLMEIFLMVAAKIGVDICEAEDSDIERDEMVDVCTKMYQIHFDEFVHEHHVSNINLN